MAKVNNYQATGTHDEYLGEVSDKVYDQYLEEIGDDPVGAVDGKKYGFPGYAIWIEE